MVNEVKKGISDSEGPQVDSEALEALSKLSIPEREAVFKTLARESQPSASKTSSQEVGTSVGPENTPTLGVEGEAGNQATELANEEARSGDSLQLLEELNKKRQETLEDGTLYKEDKSSKPANDTLEQLLQ
jgi:hypothetical protein